ncbi:MAG: hypothetical protein WKF47_13810 [Geodermatophilaceae bacterium]
MPETAALVARLRARGIPAVVSGAGPAVTGALPTQTSARMCLRGGAFSDLRSISAAPSLTRCRQDHEVNTHDHGPGPIPRDGRGTRREAFVLCQRRPPSTLGPSAAHRGRAAAEYDNGVEDYPSSYRF